MFREHLQSVVIGLMVLGVSHAHGAVTFTVSPSSVSNEYTGAITLQINGLNNSETVQVDQYLDANGNGTIDAVDWLIASFKLTDGQASVIGGVTNINVPGDSTAVDGAITAVLNFPNNSKLGQFVGKIVYRLSSPTGHFAAILKTLTVTSSSHAQSFTGTVLAGGSSVPYAAVILMAGNGVGIGGALADSAGHYTIKAAPGNYMLVPFKPGFVSDTTKAPRLALGSGATVTTNVTLVSATRTIAGRVIDAANSSLGVPATFVMAQSTNGLLAVGYSDTNGNFSVSVQANLWQLRLSDWSYAGAGYVGLQDYGVSANTIPGNVSGVAIALPKATALFYGTVKDSLNQPIVGVEVNARDQGNQYETRGITDQNGNFAVAALPGNWGFNVGNDQPAFVNYIFSRTDTNITTGEAVRLDFVGALGTSQISGYVTNTNGNPVANVWVYGEATVNGVQYNTGASTDASGYYSLNVINGTWTVGVSCYGGEESLGAQGYECVANQLATVSNNNAVVNFTVQPCGPLRFLTSSPLPAGQVGVHYNQPIHSDGCNQPFTWSISSGALPPGVQLFLDGTINGQPSNTGTFTFTVRITDTTAAYVEQSFTLTITPPCPLAVTTSALPGGTVGASYNQLLGANCGQPPYTWALAPGSGALPTGLNLAGDGTLAGTPTTAGTFNFTVRVTDTASAIADQPLSLTVAPAPPLTITVLANPGSGGTVSGGGSVSYGSNVTVCATANACYTFANWQDGATVVSTAPCYSFTAVSNRTLTANFTLLNYTITATPAGHGTTGGAGSFPCGATATVTATPTGCYAFTNWTENGAVVSTAASYSFTVVSNRALVANFVPGPVTVTTAVAPPNSGTLTSTGSADCGDTLSLQAFPNSGYGFINWTDNGVVVSTTSNYSFTVTGNHALVANFAAGLTITTGSRLPTGTIGIAYSQLLQAVNGPPPYKWSIISGHLPQGLKFNSATGAITGTPKDLSAEVFRVRVVDASQHSASNTFTLVVRDVFSLLAATYNGLILQTNAPTFTSSGAMKIVLTKTGSYAAKVTLGGVTGTFKGQFDADGNATNIVAKPAAQFLLHLDVTGATGEITGIVNGLGFSSTLVADKVAFSGSHPCPWQGKYNCLLEPTDTATTVPQGDGYATLNVTTSGNATLAGTLADGTPLSIPAPVSATGTMPLYKLSYANKGGVIGWLSFRPSNTVAAVVYWSKPVGSGRYATGFNTAIGLTGTKLVPPAGAGNWQLTLAAGDLTSAIVKTVTVATTGKVTLPPADIYRLALKVTPATGKFSGSFMHPVSKKTTPFTGLFLQTPENDGGGFFLGPSTSGVATLEP